MAMSCGSSGASFCHKGATGRERSIPFAGIASEAEGLAEIENFAALQFWFVDVHPGDLGLGP